MPGQRKLTSFHFQLYALWRLILCVNLTGSQIPRYLAILLLGVSVRVFSEEIGI